MDTTRRRRVEYRGASLGAGGEVEGDGVGLGGEPPVRTPAWSLSGRLVEDVQGAVVQQR
jgi:hypothetical protein